MVADFVRRTIGRACWRVRQDWESRLLGPEGLRLEAWRSEGRVQVVKHGDHRTVYRVQLDGRACYVKHYRPIGLWRVAQHLIRASAARRECRQALAISRRGVNTVCPIAWAEVYRGGLVRESYLVTEAIGHCCTVEEFGRRRLARIPEPHRSRIRRLVLEGFARFVAAVHRAGIRHNDFHAGNVLVGCQPQGESVSGGGVPVEFHLIDVPGVRLSGPLSWKASLASLAMIVSAWRECTSRTERLRFWHSYLAERPELQVPDRRVAMRQLDLAAREHARRIHRQRDKRSLRTNRDFRVLRLPRAWVHGVHDVPEPVLAQLAEAPEELLRKNIHRPVKLSHSSMMVEALLPGLPGDAPVLYKCYRPRNWWRAFCAMFRQGRAMRSWYFGQALFARGIDTARPLAVCTPRGLRFGRRSYLASQWIEGAENLHLYGWEVARRNPQQRARRAAQCAVSLGRLVGRMHALGVLHGDLKGSNVLIVEGEPELKTYVVDMDGVRLTSRAPPAGYVADLARLATSLEAHPWVARTACCRFLRAYVGQFPLGAIDWKVLWRKAEGASRSIIRRKRRRKEAVL